MLLQNLAVALIVLAACGYSAWKLAPAGWRKRAAQGTGTLAHAALPPAMARRIEIKAVTAAAQAGGCGSCGPCKACKTGQDADPPPPAAGD